MRKRYTEVYINDQKVNNILNAIVDGGMLEEDIFSSIGIVEEKVPGRDMPYLFRTEKEALEFEVSFAFENPLTASEIRSLYRTLFNTQKYQKIQFGDSVAGEFSPVYYFLVTGTPQIEYVAAVYRGDHTSRATIGYNQETDRGNTSGIKPVQDTIALEDGYIGILTLNLRCNAPYGYTIGEIIIDNKTENIEYKVNSDLTSNNYIARLTNKGEDKAKEVGFRINDEIFILSELEAGEEIIIDSRLRQIRSNLDINPYVRWNPNMIKIFPHFVPDQNEITFVRYDLESDSFVDITGANLELVINYKLPRLI